MRAYKKENEYTESVNSVRLIDLKICLSLIDAHIHYIVYYVSKV